MITCIVNPSRCGSTLLLLILDKYFRMSRTPHYSMEYEIIDDTVGKKTIEEKAGTNFLFKYQYLFVHKPLLGADKYIVIDRKDKDAWAYSSYHSWINQHWHGRLDPHKQYITEEKSLQVHKENMINNLDSWHKEKNRLISQGAISLWYEDIKDMTAKEILNICGYEDAIDFDKDDLYLKGVKLEKVWSEYTCNQK